MTVIEPWRWRAAIRSSGLRVLEGLAQLEEDDPNDLTLRRRNRVLLLNSSTTREIRDANA